MAATFHKKSSGTKGNGGVSGAIVPPRRQVDNFPLMTYLSQHCSFDDADDDSSLENEEALKAANDKRVDELLSQATSCVKNQSKDGSSSEEAARRSALELLHSMELKRNMNETWKVSESNSEKKYSRNFLYPLKPTKEDDYFSGVPKVKQTRERKRCRSDEVVLLDNGRLVPKNSSVDYYASNEVAQLPLKFSMPLRKPQRVPSVGLPFTPGPPVPTSNNRWMQKSGTELFSNVQSQTLLVNGHGDDDLALAIAESIRTAKEEQQRNVMLETLYQSQNEATKSSKLFSAASRGSAIWEAKPTPTDRNQSMSVDSTNENWDEEMPSLNSKNLALKPNNNDSFKKSQNTTKLNEECLNQRPRYREEQKTCKSPPPPMLADMEKSVSHEGKVITLQAPESPTKQCDMREEKGLKNAMNEEQSSENRVLVRESESKQEQRIPKTSHVPETFGSPKITSTRLPTSKPTALMTAMKNFTQRPAGDERTTHNYVGHKPRTTSTSPEVPPLLVVPKDQEPEEKYSLNRLANDKKASHNHLGHNERKATGSSEVASLPNPSKKLVQEKEKGKTQLPIAVDCFNSSPSAVPQSPRDAAFPQPQPHSPQPAAFSSSISLEELKMASVPAQHQMPLIQQGMAGTPQLLQNGQNFGGVSGQSSNKERKPELGQADLTASSMLSLPNFLNNSPMKTSSLPPTAPGLSDTSSAGRSGPVGSLQNTLPGSFSGLPITQTPSMPEIPNSSFGGIPGVMPPFSNALPGSVPGFPNFLAGPGLTNPPSGITPDLNNLLPGSMPGLINPYLSGLTNPYSGVLPGLAVPFSGAMPGLTNPLTGFIPGFTNLLPGAAPGSADSLPGAVPNLPTLPGGLPESSGFPGMPGYPNGYPGVSVSSHSNLTPPGVSGFQNVVAQDFQMNPLSSMQGLQSNLPGGAPTPVSTSLTGIQNCNSFGGFVQSFATPQPGSAPLMGGRGRGRLAPTLK